MNETMDPTHFSDLEALDPADVTARTGCEFDPATRRYRIRIWGQVYCVDLKAREIRPEDPGPDPSHDYFHLFILYFLMRSKPLPPEGKWVSEKDLKGGAAFFRGPHTLPTDWISKRFENDMAAFGQACEKLGGTPLSFGDAAFSFQITPTVPVAVVYWQGDEEFPPETRLLFDRTLDRHLPLDIVFALAVEICHAVSVRL